MKRVRCRTQMKIIAIMRCKTCGFNFLLIPRSLEKATNVMSEFTTNEEDQREAEKLRARLQKTEDGDATGSFSAYERIPNVSIAEGTHKYVLITALLPGSIERQHFVVSKRNAAYHRNAAEPYVEKLEKNGYKGISILGGGRIALDTKNRSISIYGFSYGFGLADHACSKSVIENDPKWKGYDVEWSNEGY